MIETLDDLVEHTQRLAGRLPSLAEEVLLRSPGSSSAEVRRLLSALPGLPANYVDCLRRLALEGVSLGYFELAPPKARQSGLVDALIVANGELNPFLEELTKRALVSVASYEGDPLCVAVEGSERPGEVWRLDLGYGPEPLFSRVADSFEDMLIAAGRLDEMRATGAEGWLPVEDFIESLDPFDLDEEQLRNWRFFAEMALVGVS